MGGQLAMRAGDSVEMEARRMKASYLLKQNIEALLKSRHLTKHDLAQHCRRSDAWISKILGKANRNVPLEYLDRIADFFGLATYQLFQPGISLLLERRKLTDRRTGRDRRVSALNHQVRESVSALVANLTQTDVADLIRLRALDAESRSAVRGTMQEFSDAERRNDGRRAARRRADLAAGPAATATPTGRRSGTRRNTARAEESNG